MEPMLDIIKAGLLLLSMWCSILIINDIRFMLTIKQRRGYIRRRDKITSSMLILLVVIAYVLIMHTGLIYLIPSVVTCLGVGSVVLLFHLSDLQYQNFRRLRYSERQPPSLYNPPHPNQKLT
jgi:CHASE2 domain-containing sensor protein